ncbi:MAG: heavy metal-binding domain-containing protein [Flavobacteriales bacterium]|jgi:hypothetical protein|nr:hypothetical protein [Schleiferiaceae bacterium]|tara:strand:- start:901 stop:1188 length:288 start_codon:yes stop_codon:yes gene_type:complete
MRISTTTIGALAIAVSSLSSCCCCGESCEKDEPTSITEESTDIVSEEAHSHNHYACPMDCEEGVVYEEEGTCPVCHMDLTILEDAPPEPEAKPEA